LFPVETAASFIPLCRILRKLPKILSNQFLTERLYVRVLEDVEVLRGLLREGVEAWWEGLQQGGAAIGQCVANTARQYVSGTVARKAWDRLVWVWSQSSQL
jgi:hypothetical protein